MTLASVTEMQKASSRIFFLESGKVFGWLGFKKDCVAFATRAFATPIFVASATTIFVASATPYFRTFATRTAATPKFFF